MAKFIKVYEVELDCSDWYVLCNKRIINTDVIKEVKVLLGEYSMENFTKNSEIDPKSLSARISVITLKDDSEIYVAESVDWIFEQLSKD